MRLFIVPVILFHVMLSLNSFGDNSREFIGADTTSTEFSLDLDFADRNETERAVGRIVFEEINYNKTPWRQALFDIQNKIRSRAPELAEFEIQLNEFDYKLNEGKTFTINITSIPADALLSLLASELSSDIRFVAGYAELNPLNPANLDKEPDCILLDGYLAEQGAAVNP